MNFKLSGHHLDITPALREYVETKLERVIRHFDQVIGVSVLLSVDNHKEGSASVRGNQPAPQG